MKARSDQLAIVLLAIVVVFTLVFLFLPVLVAILMSFDARSYLGPFPPTGLSFRWYLSFNSTEYLLGLKTSVIVAAVATATATIAGGAAAVCLDRYRFRGREFLTAMFLSPLVVPGVVLGFGILMFSSICGVYDGLARLIAGHVIVVLPYTVRTTLASLSGIRRSLAEAALSLGAHGGAVFREITFPLAKTGIVAGAVFAFALSMDEVSASLFLADPSWYTLPVAIVSQMRSRFHLTIAAVSALLVFFTIIIIVVLDRLVGLDRLIGVGSIEHRDRLCMDVVELKKLEKRFGSVVAVSDVSFRVRQGQCVSLLGPSGCGKTTTLRMIAGFESPDKGEVLIAGQNISGVEPYDRNVALVFQVLCVVSSYVRRRKYRIWNAAPRLRASPHSRSDAEHP